MFTINKLMKKAILLILIIIIIIGISLILLSVLIIKDTTNEHSKDNKHSSTEQKNKSSAGSIQNFSKETSEKITDKNGTKTITISPNMAPVDTGSISVHFCPNENCTKIFLETFDEAKYEIKCAIYDLDLIELVEKFNEKQKNGVQVSLVIETDNSHRKAQTGLKIYSILNDSNNAQMHNKFCIIDEKIVITGSTNPTHNDVSINKNNLVIIKSELLAKNYLAEYSEIEQGVVSGGKVENSVLNLSGIIIDNYFCPEDGCSEKIRNEIRSAQHNIYFMTFSFTDKTIADQLILEKSKGVNVSGIFEIQQRSKYSMHDYLDFQGIPIAWYNSTGKLHNKVFIVDNETVITGSMNPSKNGDENNDENIIIIHDNSIAQKYTAKYFEIFQQRNSTS